MANLIVISSIIFPCMYVSLFVRDKCERSVKNQASKGESVEFMTSLQVASKKQSAKRPRIEHMIRSWGVMPAISPSKKFMRYRCSLFTLSSPPKKGERCPVPSLCTSIYIARHKGVQSGPNLWFFKFIHCRFSYLL